MKDTSAIYKVLKIISSSNLEYCISITNSLNALSTPNEQGISLQYCWELPWCIGVCPPVSCQSYAAAARSYRLHITIERHVNFVC